MKGLIPMTKADSVHSTPRRTASKIKTNPEKPSLDLAYRRLEAPVCDLVRLCEITFNLVHVSNENPTDLPRGAHAALIAEITLDRMREFKTTYYDWYHAPPTGHTEHEGDL
jgi:hypothetical protein